MRIVFILGIILGLGSAAMAQDDRSDEKGVLYTQSGQYGILVHTGGYGVEAQFTKQRTVNNLQLVDFSIYELRDPKEILLSNPLKEQSRPYVFGKLNNLVVLKANYGTRKVLADRFLSQDIKVNFNYSIGALFGWLKPLYYDVEVLSTTDKSTTIQAKFDPNNLDYQKNTVGYAVDITKGLNESFFTFGGDLKTSMSFEWGKEDYKFYSLETGVMVDAFPAPVPIFASIKNNQVFVNLFICFTYGVRK